MVMHRRGMGLVGLVIVAVCAVALAGVTSVAARTYTVNDKSDFSDFNPGDGICNVNAVGNPVCTLRAAVEEANTTVASDTIKFNCNAIGGPIVLSTNEIEIDESVVIKGGNSKSCPIIDGGTVNAGSDDSIFEVNDGVVRFEYLQLINGRDVVGDGGCIDHDGDIDTVDIKKVYFKNCEASSGDGGAVDVDADAVNVTGSHFYNNEAQDDGGAINTEQSANVRITKSTFKGNTADGDGGAIYATGDILTVESSKFYNNTADNEGGGIKTDLGAGEVAIVINSQFKGNRADEGGAMCNDLGGTFTQFNNRDRGGNVGQADISGLQDFLCIPD